MSKYLPDETAQALYQGRWVDKSTFRVFVYSASDKKLANTYDEYCQLIETGLWFSSQEETKPNDPISLETVKLGRKRKHGTDG
jgi:hypothetical protein